MVACILALGLAQPAPVEPIGAILDAFKTHDVVALSAGEGHDDARGVAFVVAMISDPRFAPTPIDVVTENANARFQPVMDRYTRGDEVAFAELRPVWDDTTQQEVINPDRFVPDIYRVLRKVNRPLPRERQHRALLGDPPIDWDAVRSAGDFRRWLERRDSSPAEVIQREAIAKGRKALVVYGAGHLQRKQQATNYVMDSAPAQTLISLLERAAVTTFIVTTIGERDDTRRWRAPALAVIRGTSIGAEEVPPLVPTRVAVRPGGAFVPIPKEEWATLRREEQYDAVLYLGPESTRVTAGPSSAMCAEPGLVARHLQRLSLAGAPGPVLDRVRTLCGSTK